MVLEGIGQGVRPRAPVRLSDWVEANVVLIDGPRAGKPWHRDGAPYLVEILDCLSEDHPSNLVSVRKSQQTGASIAALAWMLYIADREPANTLYAAPNLAALKKLNSGKLQPLTDAWHRKINRVVIEPMTSRSGKGSTIYEKVLPGDKRLWLANANSETDLSSVTVQKGVKDELSKWEDIPGYGDPEELYWGRFTSFRRRRTWKILEISTPETDTGDVDGKGDGHCRIDRSFKASDRRFWHCRCPQCRDWFVHDIKYLVVDADDPAKTVYGCHSCGYPISDAERLPMIRAGEWRTTKPGPGRHPGFHIDAFISPMMSYEEIGKDWLKSQRGGELAKKAFANLVLGLPHAYSNNAPDHVRLMERTEDGAARGRIPPRSVILVAAADVQMRGIWVHVTAFAPNRESWVVEAEYLEGSTESPDGEVFEKLRDRILNKKWPDAFGRTREVDALGIDAKYRSHVVYTWVHDHQRAHPMSGKNVIFALNGREGWGRPALGAPTVVDINLEGRKIPKGTQVWQVGAWPLKAAFYTDLAKTGLEGGAERDPDGYCHFGTWLDEPYFKQITAEEMVPETYKGRTRQVWKVGNNRDNHWLDCRVYEMAMADYLGLSSWTDEEIAALVRLRCAPEDDTPPLLKPPAPAPAAAPAAKPESASERLSRFERLAELNAGLFR